VIGDRIKLASFLFGAFIQGHCMVGVLRHLHVERDILLVLIIKFLLIGSIVFHILRVQARPIKV